MDAFEVLVRDQAAPKNSWSNTLYSEDGKYTFTKTESGRWQMHLIDDAAVGASLEDIANWMMSGKPNKNIETRYLNYLHTVDPDLYNVAMRIGSEVRTYGFMEDLHQQGILSDSQNQYDMSLLGMLFGKDADSMRMLLHGCKESGNFWIYWIFIVRMEQNRWISFGNSNISTVELFNIASCMTGYG